MLIQRSFFSRFSPSIPQAIPQQTDKQLIIPSTFNMVGLPPEPLHLTGSGNNEQNSSFARSLTFSVTNAASATDTPCRLSTGFWEVTITGCYVSNYVSAFAGPELLINIVEGPASVSLLSRFAQVSGSQPFRETFLLMLATAPVLNSTNSLTVQLAGNGVGQTHAVQYTLICNKLL